MLQSKPLWRGLGRQAALIFLLAGWSVGNFSISLHCISRMIGHDLSHWFADLLDAFYLMLVLVTAQLGILATWEMVKVLLRRGSYSSLYKEGQKEEGRPQIEENT